MNPSTTTICLTRDEALVLFELVVRLTAGDASSLPLEHPSEKAALWALEGALEKSLVEPFKADYKNVVRVARENLSKKSGVT